MKNEQQIIEQIPADDSTDIGEKMYLYEKIKELKPKVIVEIGTHRGLTTLYMAQAILENGIGHLHTCDPNTDYNQVENFNKFEELKSLITFYPVKGVNLPEVGKIDFMFLDGYHEKNLVLEEVKAFLPRMAKKGVIVFHDTHDRNDLCDVTGALEESGLPVEYINTKYGIAVYTHKKVL